MARSKSWTESQQPENQYTHGQYWFNVIAMLLIALALIAFVLWWIRPAPKSSTNVFWVGSNSNTELRSIPFQENDRQQLIEAFEKGEVIKLEEFDDKTSFDQVWTSLKESAASFKKDPTTAIVICSAIGSVEDSKPVLQPTTSTGASIAVEQFLNDFVSSIDCQRYIVVFDCGHDFSNPIATLNDSFAPGDDFNRFVTAVDELVQTTEKQVAVITANGDGEIPLYSYNKRQTLFGLALQDSLAKDHKTVDELHESLVKYCHDQGGEAAQTPLLFKSPQFTEVELGIAKLTTPKVEEDEKEENKSEEEVPIQDKATKTELQQIAEFWRERDDVESKYQTKKETLLLPSDFDTAEWERRITIIAEKSAGLRNLKFSNSVDIGDLGRSSEVGKARTTTEQFPGLFAQENSEDESNSETSSNRVEPRSKRTIAKAFLVHHRAKLKAKYHIAIFEGLSWLDDGSRLKAYESAIDELNKTLTNDLFADEKANEADVAKFEKASESITGKLSDLDDQLDKLCHYIGTSENKHGFTREMALMCILDSPLIESGSAKPDAVLEPHDRVGLMNALKRNVDGRGDRLTLAQRESNSARRHQLFARFQKLCSQPDSSTVDLRKQDSLAYYLGVGRSKLLDLSIKPREVVHTVSLANLAELVKTKQLDLVETTIDLGLIVSAGSKQIESKVNLVCELSPEAPFEILHGTAEGNIVRIDDSDGLIRIKATKNASENSVGIDHYLKVKVADEYFDKKFVRNDAKSIEIPLALPGENRVELSLTMSDNPVTSSIQQTTGAGRYPLLRPWPNREETVALSLTNFYHKERTVRATLYACKPVTGHEIMPGNIDEKIKRETLRDLKAIAVSTPLKLEKGKPGEPGEPKKITWSAKPDPAIRMLGADEPITQGILCRIVELAEKEGEAGKNLKDIWIPVFPDTRDFFSSKNLQFGEGQDSDKVMFTYAKSPFCEDQPLKLKVKLGGKEIGGFSISAGANTGGGVIIDNWGLHESKSKTETLHIDVDGWPRRYSFIFDNGQFRDPLTFKDSTDTRFPTIQFGVENPKRDKLTIVKNSDNDKVLQTFGYTTKAESQIVSGKLKISCNTQDHFRFPGSRDAAEIQFGNELKKFFFPRDVKSSMSVDPADPSRLILQSNVSDFAMDLDLEMDDYRVDPKAFVFSDSAQVPMDGQDVTRFVFDDRSPQAPRFQIRNSAPIYPGGFVRIELSEPDDSPGGVGMDKTRSGLKRRIRATTIFDGQPKPATLGYLDDQLVVKAGKQPGDYELSIAFCDRLKNFGEATTKSFRVVPKPPPPKKEPKKKIAKAPPKPVTHVLIVTVKVGSNLLQADQEPELAIKPDEGVKKKRLGPDKFEFTGLKAGTTYSVSGEFKLTTGFGFETKGKTSPWEIPKESPRKRTQTKVLKLER